jgi:hypothetical protein
MTAPRPIPQDHLKPAVQIEAEGIEFTTIEWRGLTFDVPTDPLDFPVDAIMAAEDGKVFKSLALIIGPKPFAEFMKMKPLRRDGIDLNNAITKALGMGDSEN